ncbi:hypothetical protein NQ314_006632 [Rhamnusium bicolor]|uniref:Transposase n=1 Tax=Rhamnusium bicolor TaxID=1586634 RepID=A0AAV8YY82_9CUCU|nr:hypothetical protein NQ314_006632 [Rhamnusium bicolor]
MPGCSAFGCSNSASKGYVMKVFPRDQNRRKIWASKPDCWEINRVDGRRKLKVDAVPTIFSYLKIKSKRKPPAVRIVNEPSSLQDTVEFEHELTDMEDSTPTNIICHSPSSNSSSSSILNKVQKHKKLSEIVKLKRQIERKNKTINTMKIKLVQMKKCLQECKKSSELLNNIFHKDQINAIKRNKTNWMKWSNETIKEAIQLKFACGSSGYDLLRKRKYPLPSLRTVCRRLQGLKFAPGILYEVIEFLKIKVSNFKTEQEKDCVLIIDEMAITAAKVYDTSTWTFYGNITLPEHTGLATHAFVFMIGGISSRWKQTVAYHFTGNSDNASVIQDILIHIISLVEEIGLRVCSVTSDMGPSNQALWKKLDVNAGPSTPIKNFCFNPAAPDRKLFFTPDVPHLFKNIKSALVNKIIIIPKDIQVQFSLPSNRVDISHINDLIEFQRSFQCKLAPKLNEADLNPSHYEKMRVSNASHVLSSEVSSALKFMAQELKRPEYLTTAWFVEVVCKWFELMTSRHPIMALSRINEDIYKKTLDFLKTFIDIFKRAKIGARELWKPVQKRVIITTQSILDIQQIFLEDKGYTFLLTSRFTQDCLENFFCVIRSKQVIPNAVQFKNNLKSICISQYLKSVNTGSYDVDDREFLSEFLDLMPKLSSPTNCESNDIIIPELPEPENLSSSEINSLYNIAGYIVKSVLKNSKTCRECVESIGSKNFNSAELKIASQNKIKSSSLSSKSMATHGLGNSGTYIPIKAPINPEVINRKCFYGITLQVICDYNRKFIDIFCGYPSSVSDNRIFRNSDIFKNIIRDRARFFSENQFIIGDKAYPLCMYCITPYIDRGNLQAHHLHFNKRHAQTRQVIERSFALLFGRFRRLKYLDMTKTEFIPQTVQAACVLHNVCLMHQGNFEQYEEEGLQFLNIQNYDHDDNEEALGVEGIAREFREHSFYPSP